MNQMAKGGIFVIIKVELKNGQKMEFLPFCKGLTRFVSLYLLFWGRSGKKFVIIEFNDQSMSTFAYKKRLRLLLRCCSIFHTKKSQRRLWEASCLSSDLYGELDLPTTIWKLTKKCTCLTSNWIWPNFGLEVN